MSSFCEKNVFVCTSCGARPQRSLKGRPPVVPGYDPRTIGRTETAGLGARGQVCSDLINGKDTGSGARNESISLCNVSVRTREPGRGVVASL